MCDYKEEQSLELEALESIYPESFEVVEENPKIFELKVFSEEDEEVTEFGVLLRFTYTKKYPEESPLYEIKKLDDESIEDEFLNELSNLVTEQIDESLGEVMIFNIISAVQEHINEKKDEIKRKAEEEKARKEKEEKEAEQKKCHGTPVTIPTFMAWKEKFLKEMEQNENQKKVVEKKNKKLTGKEIFIKKWQSGDEFEDEEVVEVDESLFEDLDELDLLDED